MRKLTDLVRSFWSWGRRPGIKVIRRVLGIILVALAIVWFLGSIWIDDLKLCSESKTRRGVERTCERATIVDVAVFWLPGLVLLGWGIEELSIPGVGTLRPPPRRPRNGDGEREETTAPPARERFLERWTQLDPWSHLASRLSSPNFCGQLAGASASPGRVDRQALARADAELIKSLELGSRFTAAEAKSWADAERQTLNRLRLLADPTRNSTDREYDDGAAKVDELLADLKGRGLLR